MTRRDFMPGGDKDGWRFDLRINIPIILTLLTLGLSGAWQAASLWASQEENRRRIAVLEKQIRPIPVQLARVEAVLNSVDKRMGEIMDRVRESDRVHNNIPRLNDGD